MHDEKFVGGWDTVIDTQKTGAVNDSENVENSTDLSEGVSEQEKSETDSVSVDKVVENGKEIVTGDSVVHKSFGSGIVVTVYDKFIIVKFHDRESKFFYPEAFEKGYLEKE